MKRIVFGIALLLAACGGRENQQSDQNWEVNISTPGGAPMCQGTAELVQNDGRVTGHLDCVMVQDRSYQLSGALEGTAESLTYHEKNDDYSIRLFPADEYGNVRGEMSNAHFSWAVFFFRAP